MHMESIEPKERKIPDLLYRAAIGALIFIVALLVGISAAHAAYAMDLIPQVGLTKSADGSGGAKSYVGLSLRGSLLPFFKHETSVGYRSDEVYGGLLKTATVPVTESIYFAPIPLIYAGGGVGMYFTSLTYQNLPIPNSSDHKLGYHVGGGVNFPLAPMISVDLNTKYVFMDKVPTGLAQGSFNPDFWSTSAGVAIHF
jgi:opacity protein-like surface antigen